MSWPLVQIGKYAEKVRTWNPAAGAEGVFQYVDLSSVDKSRKIIALNNVAEISSAEAPSRARQLVVTGDVLVATVRPNLNGVAVVPAELNAATASTGYCVLRADEESLHGRYLFHWVQTDSFVEDMMSKATGANYPAVSDKIIKESKIPLPPLPEQKRIAAILDKADTIRRKRQQAIQLADDFLRAVFLDMFGDPGDNLKIEDMLSQKYLLLHKDGNHGSNYPAKEEFGDYGVVFISAKDISDQDGSIDYASVAHLNESKAKKLTIGWLEKGDVLLAHNATVGRVGLFSGEVDEALIGTSLTAYRPNQEKLSSVYLFAALKYSGFQEQLKQNMGQSTRNQVPITAQRSLKIPVGDLKRQRQFEEIFIELKKVKTNLYAGLKESDEMFSSLGQKAFAGQL